MLQMFPELFSQKQGFSPSPAIPPICAALLAACAPPACKGKPVVAVLTPGIYNSAYFETRLSGRQDGRGTGRGA